MTSGWEDESRSLYGSVQGHGVNIFRGLLASPQPQIGAPVCGYDCLPEHIWLMLLICDVFAVRSEPGLRLRQLQNRGARQEGNWGTKWSASPEQDYKGSLSARIPVLCILHFWSCTVPFSALKLLVRHFEGHYFFAEEPGLASFTGAKDYLWKWWWQLEV